MEKELELGLYDNEVDSTKEESIHFMNYFIYDKRDAIIPKDVGLFWSNYRGNTFFDMLMLKSWEEHFVEIEKEFTKFLFGEVNPFKQI